MDDHFEFRIIESNKFTTLASTLENALIWRGHILEMPLKCDRSGELRFVEDPEKTGVLSQIFEKRLKTGDLACRLGTDAIGADLDEMRHLQTKGWQQFIKQGLTAGKVLVECAERDIRDLCDPSNRCFGIAKLADDLRRSFIKAVADLLVAFATGKLPGGTRLVQGSPP